MQACECESRERPPGANASDAKDRECQGSANAKAAKAHRLRKPAKRLLRRLRQTPLSRSDCSNAPAAAGAVWQWGAVGRGTPHLRIAVTAQPGAVTAMRRGPSVQPALSPCTATMHHAGTAHSHQAHAGSTQPLTCTAHKQKGSNPTSSLRAVWIAPPANAANAKDPRMRKLRSDHLRKTRESDRSEWTAVGLLPPWNENAFREQSYSLALRRATRRRASRRYGRWAASPPTARPTHT